MGVGNSHPNSLANLRPPFQRGNAIRAGSTNQFRQRANELRDDIWKAASPEYRAAMAKNLCELSLGRGEEPVFDEDGVPVLCPDGSPKMRPLPPDRRAEMMRWSTDTLLKVLGGSFSFQAIEADVSVTATDQRCEVAQAIAVLVGRGLLQAVPPRLREPVVDQPTDPTPAR